MYQISGAIFGALILIVLETMYDIPWWLFLLIWLAFIPFLIALRSSFGRLLRSCKYALNVTKWNADLKQQALAKLFIDTIEGRKSPGDIVAFLTEHGWAGAEAEDRACHALSMVRVLRVDLYPKGQLLFKIVCSCL
jgi:hypothetical protein